MNTERQVRLFRDGRNQALRIPRDMEFPGEAATLRKEGSRLPPRRARPLPRLIDPLEFLMSQADRGWTRSGSGSLQDSGTLRGLTAHVTPRSCLDRKRK